MSTIKVDGIRSNSASSDAITLANDGTCTANITNNLSNRNLVINGAMQVAQRGTSSTSTGYQTVDRITTYHGGTDEAPTYSQADVAAGTTPYSLGFRKCFKITNGNQTSGLGAADQLRIDTLIEAQDFANSGWNYTSASSYITLSYWVKSSVAQEFFGYLYIDDNPYKYGWSLGSLSADTWTKITVTIPGNSNLAFNNDNGVGCWLNLLGIWGTDKTASDAAPNTWGVWDGTKRSTDQAATWYSTNDATFEITGVQLEVGSVATDFEHRSFGQELALCQRYFYKTYDYATAPGTATFVGMQHGRNFDPNSARSAVPICLNFPVRMRAVPTLTWYAGDGQSNRYSTGSTVGGTNLTTENSVGTDIDESETGIYHANFSEDVPATNLFAYHVTASAEL